MPWHLTLSPHLEWENKLTPIMADLYIRETQFKWTIDQPPPPLVDVNVLTSADKGEIYAIVLH